MCGVVPPAQFDFTLADPAIGNLYERLKVTYLFLCPTQSPVRSTLLNTIQQFEQLAAHTTSTVAKYAVQSVNSSMTESIPSNSAMSGLHSIYYFGFIFRQLSGATHSTKRPAPQRWLLPSWTRRVTRVHRWWTRTESTSSTKARSCLGTVGYDGS